MAQEHVTQFASAGWIDQALFGFYPYIALTVLVIGSIIRFDREPYSWRSGSSQLLRRKQLVMGSVLFHLGVLVIFAGHLVGLLTPIAVFDALGVSHGAKQMLAMGAGGVAGAFAIIGALMLLHRRLFDARIRATTNFGDTSILALLTLQLALGLSTIPLSSQHMDGSEMIKFMNWAQGIFTLNPNAADYVGEVHWIFKSHLFVGLTIFLVFPFTRLVHMLSAPIWFLFRRGWQLVRSRRDLAADKARKSAASGGM